jgi:hypothetical protein
MNPTTKSPDLKDSDYKFAINIGIKFYMPEELFAKELLKKPCEGGRGKPRNLNM